MPKLDENKIIIAHSLGCLTVLHCLTAHFSQR
ncbi:alpha/beta hydrolase [Acinetobacter sp. CFCC 11171]